MSLHGVPLNSEAGLWPMMSATGLAARKTSGSILLKNTPDQRFADAHAIYIGGINKIPAGIRSLKYFVL